MPFFLADGLYLLLVFGWTLWITPLGRDYALLARPDRLGFVPGALLEGMVRLFGAWSPGYLLVNLALLYGCMALLLVLMRSLSKGPWWLGSIAAVLFMANPAKTEAVLSLGGVADLLTGFFGLLVLVVYVGCRSGTTVFYRFLPLLVYVGAILVSPDCIPLVMVLILLEAFFFSHFADRRSRLRPFLFIGILAYFISRLPYSGRSAVSILQQLDPALEEAGLRLGAPPSRSFS